MLIRSFDRSYRCSPLVFIMPIQSQQKNINKNIGKKKHKKYRETQETPYMYFHAYTDTYYIIYIYIYYIYIPFMSHSKKNKNIHKNRDPPSHLIKDQQRIHQLPKLAGSEASSQPHLVGGWSNSSENLRIFQHTPKGTYPKRPPTNSLWSGIPESFGALGMPYFSAGWHWGYP